MKTYMVVEVEYNARKTDPESIAYALDELMDTSRDLISLSEYGNPRVKAFFPVDAEDITQLQTFNKLQLTVQQRDALQNILQRLGVEPK